MKLMKPRRASSTRAGFLDLLLAYVLLTLISELLRPKPRLEDAKAAGLDDFKFPTATEGRSIPLVWGTVRLKGPNVVWYGDLEQVAVKKKVKTGLISSETVITAYNYYVGIQFALCRGPAVSLLRVWVGDDEVYDTEVTHLEAFLIDKPELFGGNELGNGGFVGGFQFFAGEEDQPPSGYLGVNGVDSVGIAAQGEGYAVGDVLTFVGGTSTADATVVVTKVTSYYTGTTPPLTLVSGVIDEIQLLDPGDYSAFPSSPVSPTGGGGTGAAISFSTGSGQQLVGNNNRTPAYCGLSYVVGRAYVGNSTSIKPVAWEVRRIPNGLGLSTAEAELNGGNDANPMNVIYEVLTDTTFGLGIATAKIDTTSFTSAAATLATENNGMSFSQDAKKQAFEILNLAQQQIDGVLYYDYADNKYKIKLIRADYTASTIDEINESNSSLLDFDRGSWEGTTNFVDAKYTSRDKDYQDTSAVAQDSANIRIQDNVVISGTRNYPACKDDDLASVLAWRDLRVLSYPLVRATVRVDQEFWNVKPGEPLALTSSALGITRLPMRVIKIDYGDPTDNAVKLSLVQDVFYFAVGSFAPTGDTGWEPPSDTLIPFPTGQQLAFEQPRAFAHRDPEAATSEDPRIYTTARKQGAELLYRIHAKLQSDSTYAEFGDSFGFMRIGELTSALGTTGTTPIASVGVTASPDAQQTIRSLFDTNPPITALGTDLAGLVLVGNEFMLVQDASNSGLNVTFENVYRGVLDSTREEHAAGADVYCLVGGGLGTGPFNETDALDVKLQPRSSLATLDLTSVAAISLTMDKRARRPYPVGELSLDGSAWTSTVSLEALGGSAEATGFEVSWVRRDYRTADGGNEIAALSTDASSLFSDFPAANGTEYEVQVWNDPDGTPVQLLTFSSLSGTSQDALRLSILKETDGDLPTRMRVVVQTSHTDDSQVLTSRYNAQHDFDVTSALSGYFEFTALDTNDVSASYTANASGSHSFFLSSSFTTGDVERRVNGGAWTTLIPAGNTAGSITGVAVSDTIEVRHTSTDASALKQLTMNAPGAGTDGFAVLFT